MITDEMVERAEGAEREYLLTTYGVAPTELDPDRTRAMLAAAASSRLVDPVEVVTVKMRSEPSETPCICCAGPDYRGHVFCHAARDPETGEPDKLRDWVSQALYRAPEGVRLRFSVEVVG